MSFQPHLLLNTSKTESYLFLWIMDMIHDRLIPITTHQHLYYLVDVIIFTIGKNNPEIINEFALYRNVIWQIFLQKAHHYNILNTSQRHDLKTCIFGECPMRNSNYFFIIRDSETFIFNAIIPSLDSFTYKDDIIHDRENDFYHVAPVAIDAISTIESSNAYQNITNNEIVYGLPHIFDYGKELDIKPNMKARAPRYRHTTHKQKAYIYTYTVDFEIWGELLGRLLLIHDFKYEVVNHHVQLKLNGATYTKPAIPKRIREVYAKDYKNNHDEHFQQIADNMTLKHASDVGMHLFTTSLQHLDYSLLTDDKICLVIGAYIFGVNSGRYEHESNTIQVYRGESPEYNPFKIPGGHYTGKFQ